jgi:ABC-type nitrate/sulfonate/bicarbonate transport system permease component
VATLVGVVALWQAGVSAGLIPTLFLPAPVSIARALWALTVSGELWRHLSASLMRLAVGWVVGTVFGIGEGSKLATLGFGVFFPTVIATVGGVDNVPRGLIRMGQSFGLSHWRIVRSIVLPAALPAILSGFRVTTSIAIVLLVAAEMIGAERGIGAFVLSAGNLYDTDNLLAGIVVLSVLGLLVSWIIGRLERVLLRWR